MLSLVEMSIYGGIMIIVILLLRKFAKDKLSKIIFAYLWIAASIRLILPFRINFEGSIYQMVDTINPIRMNQTGLINTNILSEVSTKKEILFNLNQIIWIIGVIAVAFYFIYSHLKSRFNYTVSLPVENSFIKEYLENNRLRRPIQVRYSDRIGSPLTTGILWPVILLPKSIDWQNKQALSFILAHEIAHIRNFDILKKWALAALASLHWFNPLVWMMYVAANHDIELVCDELVVTQYGHQYRKDYAMTLVEMEERRGQFAPLTSGFSKSSLHQRVVAILKMKHFGKLSFGVGVGIVLVITMMFATNAPLKVTSSLPKAYAGNLNNEKEEQVSEEDFNSLLEKLHYADYKDMNLADFNRNVYAILANDEDNKNMLIVELASQELPKESPILYFFRNTIQASFNEYISRLEEVYSDEDINPLFWGQVEVIQERKIVGKVSTTVIYANYSFSYRILKAEALTVEERDQFLQNIMQCAQDALQSQVDKNGDKEMFLTEFIRSAEEYSNFKITFIDAELDDLEVVEDN